MEGKDSPWTLERVTTISRMKNLSVSITISIAIWQKNTDPRKKNKKRKLVSNVKKNTLPKTVKEHS